MGRHSAPGDEEVDGSVHEPADAGLTLVTGVTGMTGEAGTTGASGGTAGVAEARGRHARADAAVGLDTAADDTATAVIHAVDIAEPSAATGPIPPVEAPSGEARSKGESNTQADLRMLRDDPGVRWLVLGGVVVAFAVYTLVMLAIGKLSDYAYWVWIPIVLSGVLVGAVLDWAHRRAKTRAAG